MQWCSNISLNSLTKMGQNETSCLSFVFLFCGQSHLVAGMLCILQLAVWLQNAAELKHGSGQFLHQRNCGPYAIVCLCVARVQKSLQVIIVYVLYLHSTCLFSCHFSHDLFHLCTQECTYIQTRWLYFKCIHFKCQQRHI